jgi:hypothetical protein
MFSIGDVNGNGPPPGTSTGLAPGMSESTSKPTVVTTPENGILDQLSGVAAGLAQQMVGWAQGVFAKTSAVTDQAVNNFFQTSQSMKGFSDQLTGQYNNLFAPENAQLVADANSYASPARMAVDMGQAGATQAQAGDQALHNSEEALKSYGIDPSSGRYAALDKAAAVQNSANVAGAMNTQRNADIATGQRLRSEAVQVGAQLPGAIANVNNVMTAANTGAANASDANANTGANLMNVGNNYLKTAMGIPLSPVANTTQSQSYNPQRFSTGSGGNPFPDDTGGGSSSPAVNPFGNSGGSSSGSQAWDPASNYTQDSPYSPIGGGGGGGGGGAGIINLSDSQQNYGPDGGGGIDYSALPTDYNSATNDYSDSGGDYAQGGIVHNFRPGGPVTTAMSPSHGQQTDDVHANVNAGEFVVPKDVVAHKGSEFFQNLIAKSRKARMLHQAGQRPAMR